MKCILNGIRISSVATCLPKTVLEISSLANEFGEKEIEKIIKATGIERVHLTIEGQTASDICVEAAEYVISKEGINKETIDGLIFVSHSFDYSLPMTSIIMQDRLGLSKDTMCIDLPCGCTGFLYGLYQASLMISSGSCKKILLLTGDTPSKIINPADKAVRTIFGECGSATVIEKGDSFIGISLCADGSLFESVIVPVGGARKQRTKETGKIIFDDDNNGRSENDLYMDGPGVFYFGLTHVHKNVNELLEYVNWEKDDVDTFAIHQANSFMLDSLRKKIRIGSEKVPIAVKDYGNTGPSCIPLTLCSKCSKSEYRLNKVIMTGIGDGMSWGSAACDLSKTNLYFPIVSNL